jgi:hypothetical protein
MKKNKTAKRSKRIGGILDINTLVPAVNNLRYLVWNTIPEGTLVLYINPENPQHYGIYVVRGGPSSLSFYTLENTLQPNNTLRCSSDNFRIIVQINNTINYDTGAQIINRIFYGLITGYGTIGTHGGIYVTGLDNNNLIYNTYALNGQNLSSSITVITYDDINPNRAGTIDISRGETLNLFNTMANYISGGGNDERRNQLIDLRILNDQGQWIIPNYEDAQDTPPVPGFNFGRTSGRPRRGPQGGPQNSHQYQSIRDRWLEESEGQANRAAFGNYAARASYGPPVEGESVFDIARRQEAERQAERQRGQPVENREQEPIVNIEERLDDWIEEQNQIIVEDLKRNPDTGRIIPAVRRPKTDSEKRNEQKVSIDKKKAFLNGIKNGSNDEKCPICQDTFAKLSSEQAPYNEIYSCKNIHPVCGYCKNIMDDRPKTDSHLWAHTNSIWKCIVCNNVSRNADRLEDFEEAYKEANKTYDQSKSGGSSTTMYKNVGKKEILGTTRIIYKMKGSNKEYVKNKGIFVHITEYKNLKNKNKKK